MPSQGIRSSSLSITVSVNSQPVRYGSNRAMAKGAMSCSVVPRKTSSLSISPVTLENLKPCPENPPASHTCPCSGCRSMMKSSSGVSSYLQTVPFSSRPAGGKR